ncbi:lipase family alpha/beta hydrolase [Thaumasiovibrio subtropicus]|uniref:lipase family alpha/beta hydrolase n=1 Tax=Thaumasiovibrio subtropicus TaxID=1891207 RepID=UPI000B34AC40|nr:alpha/beta fold hydrolase [Thaumasiovibrio subtropicus]
MKVVVIHGLYMNGLVMMPLCNRIKQAGFEVLNLSYNTIEPDTDAMFAEIREFAGDTPTVLVGHSMGGVMSRQYLEATEDENILAVVTLGTPHQGAKIAKYIHNIGLRNVMLRGSAPYLMPRKVKWHHKARLYSLAGRLPFGVLPIILQGTERASDGTVLLDETKIDGMWEHKVVAQNHESMLVSKEVADWVIDVLFRESNMSPLPNPEMSM